jgi:hypothetical protein
MVNFGRTLRQLHAERSRAEKEIRRLDEAITVFERLVRTNSRGSAQANSKGARKLSAATRRRMAKAQKARWAKVREQQGKPKG